MNHTGTLRHDVDTASLSEWGVGGMARTVYSPANATDAGQFLSQLRIDEPLLVHGYGAFLVIRDGGFSGVILSTLMLDDIRTEEDGLYVEAGARCAQVAHFANTHHVSGYDWLAGLPGTIGGALMTHAGVAEHRVWPFVSAVNMLDRGGRTHRRSRESFGIGPLRAGSNRHAGEMVAGVWLNADGKTPAGAPGQLSGPRAIAQLFAAEDMAAVLESSDALHGAVRIDRDSAQLHLDAQADATSLEQAINTLCAHASLRTGKTVGCRLRFAGDAVAKVKQ